MKYNPDRSPDPTSWLNSDEQARIDAVLAYHRAARTDLPSEEGHAAFHVIVENQLAMPIDAVVETAARLQAEGLTRHDTIHAIASVMSREMFDLLQSRTLWSDEADQRYARALGRLTAANWRSGVDRENDE